MGEGSRRDARRRLTVDQAADQLGVSVDAVRARIKRRTIAHEREGGRVYVLLDADQYTDQGAAQPSVVARLENEVRFLREELARKDAILLNMTEAMKALSPPQEEPPEAPREATEQPGRVAPQPAVESPQGAAQRPWWQRIFGG